MNTFVELEKTAMAETKAILASYDKPSVLTDRNSRSLLLLIEKRMKDHFKDPANVIPPGKAVLLANLINYLKSGYLKFSDLGLTELTNSWFFISMNTKQELKNLPKFYENALVLGFTNQAEFQKEKLKELMSQDD